MMDTYDEKGEYFQQKLSTDIESAIPTFYGYMGIACALVFANLGAE